MPLAVAAVLALVILAASHLGLPPAFSGGGVERPDGGGGPGDGDDAAGAPAPVGKRGDGAAVATVDLLGGGVDLRYHLADMRRLQASVMAELRQLEQQRGELKAAIERYQEQLTAKQREAAAFNVDTLSVRLALDELRAQLREQHELRDRPRLRIPEPLFAPAAGSLNGIRENVGGWGRVAMTAGACRLHSCFDYSRCSVTTGFPVYVYAAAVTATDEPAAAEAAAPWLSALQRSEHATRDPDAACLYVAVVSLAGATTSAASSNGTYRGDDNAGAVSARLQRQLRLLSRWGGEGRNHLLLLVGPYDGRHRGERRPADLVTSWPVFDSGLAMRVGAFFTAADFSPDFDVVAHVASPSDRSELAAEKLPLAMPARRSHLLTFDGEPPDAYIKLLSAGGAGRDDRYSPTAAVATAELRFVDDMWRLAKEADGFSFDVGCLRPATVSDGSVVVRAAADDAKKENSDADDADEAGDAAGAAAESQAGRIHDPSEWRPCGSRRSRLARLARSTFALVVPPANASLLTTPSVLEHLLEALEAGAVPVVLGGGADGRLRLPFDGAGSPLAWHEAALLVPRSRVVELPLILGSMSDGDVVAMRLRGRELLEHHLGSAPTVVSTLLALVRTRLSLPARPVLDEPSAGALGAAAVPPPELTYTPRVEAPDELLGLVEPPFASPTFARNFSTVGSSVHFFGMFASTPWDPLLPTDAKFRGSSYGFRPINGGQGGAGAEFSMALGGNSPKEQFTVVVLTFDRTELMMSQLESYKSLPNLNKVVVVWNNPVLPAAGLKWPDIGVPINVLKMSKNSLNNRFLPFDVIETEAVLSVDDDVFLRPDEITFAFRVWRENRDRLVGFPGRYHAWDAKHGNWLYNSNHSCELSLVLTGAAFFHKYYMHVYSKVMQPAIRAKVDEFMNCEDLAMNFLIAHISKKPPIKVTSRWTFLCPSCGDSALWTDKSHFQERHECINYFTRVYGYTPLLYTQYRADSVLFKTKVPSDRSKCFKYV